MIRIALLVVALISATCVTAQERDSNIVKQDTLKPLVKPTPSKATTPVIKSAARIEIEKMPGRAALRSAIIPGWGQLTNKRWWKVPLVYGGWVGIALVYDFNQSNYKLFLTEAQNREFNTQNPKEPQRPVKPGLQQYTNTGIINIKDGYRRNRDLTILGGAAFYAVTIIDAYVDAKFFRFDISDELALKVTPALQPQTPTYAYTAPLPAVKISLSFSK